MEMSITYTVICTLCSQEKSLIYKESDKPSVKKVQASFLDLGWKQKQTSYTCPICVEANKPKCEKIWDGCKLEESEEMKILFEDILSFIFEHRGIKYAGLEDIDISFIVTAINEGGILEDSGIYLLNKRANGQTYKQIDEEIEMSSGRANSIMKRTIKKLKHPRLLRRLLKGYD